MKTFKLFLAVMAIVGLMTGCNSTEETAKTAAPEAKTGQAPAAPAAPATPAKPAMTAGTGEVSSFVGKVVETMDSGGYTYAKIDNGSETFWAAAPAVPLAVGDDVAVIGPMPMPGYTSKTLDRTFDMLYFANTMVDPNSAPASGATDATAPIGDSPHGKVTPDKSDMDFSAISAPEGGKTISQLFTEKDALGGTEVKLRGKIVKANQGIMGTNWYHLQDGSGDDLTFTSDDLATVGDTVTITGQLSLNKDFGYGYKYDVILEKAMISVE